MPTLVWIGLTDLPNSDGLWPPWTPPLSYTSDLVLRFLTNVKIKRMISSNFVVFSKYVNFQTPWNIFKTFDIWNVQNGISSNRSKGTIVLKYEFKKALAPLSYCLRHESIIPYFQSLVFLLSYVCQHSRNFWSLKNRKKKSFLSCFCGVFFQE